ncbi:MAG: helix-turn-helix transcriptional regulator [Clostridiales bacterium]|nr:helix-turn-helix transcriptional regulator [Clostridiales bacterium]MBQ1572892.1 helix-turn-helix transcriptional regulator [Clostridiales bacterium]
MKTKREDMNPFYRVVDTLCAKKGISHRELAERIGVGEVTLSRYLNGERKVQLSPFMSMCKVLDINPESLFKTYTYARLEQRVIRYREQTERSE